MEGLPGLVGKPHLGLLRHELSSYGEQLQNDQQSRAVSHCIGWKCRCAKAKKTAPIVLLPHVPFCSNGASMYHGSAARWPGHPWWHVVGWPSYLVLCRWHRSPRFGHAQHVDACSTSKTLPPATTGMSGHNCAGSTKTKEVSSSLTSSTPTSKVSNSVSAWGSRSALQSLKT